MNAKRIMGIALTAIVLLLLAAGIRMAQSPGVAAEGAPRVLQEQPAAPAQMVAQGRPAAVLAQPASGETIAGALVTEVFTLHAGWNTIYLGVEPVNPSPEISSTMRAVFAGLAAGGALESVWTYSQPVSNKDYIVDPGEGLWDEAGWLRWVPEENIGPDGASRGFLSTLYSLHANTGYLVKLKDGASGTITVSGKPVPGHHRWAAGSYNLTGFPLTETGVSVGAFTAGSPITEVRALAVDGTWSAPMSGQALTRGVAYLVRYSDTPARTDYTAPLDLTTAAGRSLSDGLSFKPGLHGNSATLMANNLTTGAISLTVALPEGGSSGIALTFVDTGSGETDLRDGPKTISLPGSAGTQLEFMVPIAEQPAAGEAILEISCASLGTRWLIPITAEAGSYAGLWVGDVIVNQVSEARLGNTDAANNMTIALASANASGVRGSAVLQKIVSGTLAVTITLALPSETARTAVHPETTAPAVHGYVFIDANQNGQHDGGEIGLEGVVVHAGTYTTTSLADGSYWLSALSQGQKALSIDLPAGYTSAFPVSIPAAVVTGTPTLATNVLPAQVTLDSVGAITATHTYLEQVLPYSHTLPYYDANDNRVEPPFSFGYVREDTAALHAGTCDQPRETLAALGAVKNGQLVTTAAGTIDGLAGDAHIAIERNGARVACGNLVISSPTAFSDGRGSVARFRLLLRVGETGYVELLPYYELTGTQRVSAVNFLSLQDSVMSAVKFGLAGQPLEFDLTIPANDPLNPFKHKYNPDLDNLDRKFQNYSEIVKPYQYESPAVERRVTLILTDDAPNGEELAGSGLDWGGALWGGDYREVVDGVHKNIITARGYFVIRRVLPLEQLRPQAYDAAGGAQ